MKIDLLHNKIIKDTVTSHFTDSFSENLVPKLVAKYGDSLLSVQMYEDYISDGFIENNEFYYPLTLVFENEIKREWIKWNISNKKNFEGGVPYAYVGEDYLDFQFADEVPLRFEEKLVGRGMYFEGGCVTLNIQSASPDKTFLSGKYSQTFIDEMSRQLTREIEKAYSVSGLSESGVELTLFFAPGTYMEHVEENVTYRRLLITARGCSPRDLWIKWTRNNGAAPLTVSDNVARGDVTFEIGEDVPHKVREKEYRFLVRKSSDQYQSAMGRKHITEWRDMMKRVIKRGELVKNEIPAIDQEKNNELTFKLQEVLTGYTAPETVPADEQPTEEKNDLAELLKGVLGVTDSESSEDGAPALDIYNEQYADEPSGEADEVVSVDGIEDEIAVDESSETEEEALFEPEAEILEDSVSEGACDVEDIREAAESKTEGTVEDTYEADIPESREDCLRSRIEAEVREKLELEAKIKAEAETLYLRRVYDELKAENERLVEIARRAEEKRLASEAERNAEAEKLRLEIEARERAEAREKERIAEAARLAVLEHQRLEAERAEEERRRREEEERIREERARLEEEAKAAEARRIEEERIRAEMAVRAAEEARAAEAAAKEASIAKESEDAAIEAAAIEAKAAANKAAPNYNYTSKNARLLFRRPVDPNITKRIHEIILTTVKYFHKENVYIKVKATVPDSTTVNLHFVKIPEEETELLVNIIKVLGKSDLGITKVFLE